MRQLAMGLAGYNIHLYNIEGETVPALMHSELGHVICMCTLVGVVLWHLILSGSSGHNAPSNTQIELLE